MSQLDRSHLQQLVELGGPELVEEVIRIFMSEAPDFQQKMKDYFAHNEQTKIAELAHKMKSSSANLGLAQLSAHCLDVEKRIKKGGVAVLKDIDLFHVLVEEGKTELISYKKTAA